MLPFKTYAGSGRQYGRIIARRRDVEAYRGRGEVMLRGPLRQPEEAVPGPAQAVQPARDPEIIVRPKLHRGLTLGHPQQEGDPGPLRLIDRRWYCECLNTVALKDSHTMPCRGCSRYEVDPAHADLYGVAK